MSEMTPDLHTKNILDILNDDCIDEILRRLDNMEDILSTAKVCKRLQMCTKQYYRIKYATEVDVVKITHSRFDPVKRGSFRFKRVQMDTKVVDKYSHTLQVNIVVPFLKMFGSMIKSISLHSSYYSKNDVIFQSIIENCKLKELRIHDYFVNLRDDVIFQSIIENCKLKELRIDGYYANFGQIPFELESLHVMRSLPTNFVFLSNFLKNLHISELYLDEHKIWFMQKMPKLTCFSVKDANDLTDDMVFEFLSLNPQLKIIEFQECSRLTPLILKAIANCAHLVELHLCDIDFWASSGPDAFNANIRHLSSMKNLKFLSIDLDQSELFETLFDLIAENDIPIETMWITLVYWDDARLPSCSNLRPLNTLKHLVLDIFSLSLSSARVVGLVGRLVETHTSLEEFALNCRRMAISIETLASFLKYRTNLKIFKLEVEQLTGDLNGLKKALQKRVRVEIIVCYSDIKDVIPVKALDEYREWIDIRYIGHPT